MHIWTAQQIKNEVLESIGLSVPLAKVRTILRNDFDMRYRVLKKVEY